MYGVERLGFMRAWFGKLVFSVKAVRLWGILGRR